jgi:hypothetical protein
MVYGNYINFIHEPVLKCTVIKRPHAGKIQRRTAEPCVQSLAELWSPLVGVQ